jgi:hypothetical protein
LILGPANRSRVEVYIAPFQFAGFAKAYNDYVFSEMSMYYARTMHAKSEGLQHYCVREVGDVDIHSGPSTIYSYVHNDQ